MALYVLGNVCVNNGRIEEALEHYLDCLNLYKRRYSGSHQMIRDVSYKLACLWESVNELSKAQ